MLLQGIRVIEMAAWAAGPAVGGVMADWGADVVKIEPPSGDPMRSMFKSVAGIEVPSNPAFELDNRGKRSVVLDLGKEQALGVARRLVAQADVFLTNYRHDALLRLGLDYASLAGERDGLIYAHLTGYGQEGPDRDRAGYDIGAFWARSGIARLLAHEGDPPVSSRGAFGDHVTAMHCLSGIMGALFHRERTGEGQLVDASLLRSGIYTIGWDIAQQLEFHKAFSVGRREEAISPTVNSYRTGDGRWVWLLGVEAERHWPRLLEALERTDLKDDPRFSTAVARRENARELIATLDAELAKHPMATWTARFDAVDLWWSPVHDAEGVTTDPQALASGAVVEIPRGGGQRPLRSVASPVRFGKVDVTPKAAAPKLGEHTDEVLRQAGLGEAEISRLREAKMLG